APNNNVGTVQVVFQGAGAFSNIGDVTEPNLPLLAATGGVEASPPADGRPLADTTPPADGTPAADTTPPPPSPAPPHPVIIDDGVLSQAELNYFVDAAIARWSATGLTAEQVAALEHMSFSVADMAGLNLGAFAPGAITLDADAAGRGWYLDATPRDDA